MPIQLIPYLDNVEPKYFNLRTPVSADNICQRVELYTIWSSILQRELPVQHMVYDTAYLLSMICNSDEEYLLTIEVTHLEEPLKIAQ